MLKSLWRVQHRWPQQKWIFLRKKLWYWTISFPGLKLRYEIYLKCPLVKIKESLVSLAFLKLKMTWYQLFKICQVRNQRSIKVELVSSFSFLGPTCYFCSLNVFSTPSLCIPLYMEPIEKTEMCILKKQRGMKGLALIFCDFQMAKQKSQEKQILIVIYSNFIFCNFVPCLKNN